MTKRIPLCLPGKGPASPRAATITTCVPKAYESGAFALLPTTFKAG